MGRCNRTILCALALLTALSGCSVGSAYRRPDAPLAGSWRDSQANSAVSWPAADWWRGFGSPQLDAFIEQARRANYDVAAAAARVREAEQTYMQAVNRLAEMAVNARSQARESYQHYRSSYDLAARYRNEVLPLRKIISDEMVLRYNAMMIDVFALLTEARQRVVSTTSGVEAQRDFWLAAVDLDAAILGGGVSAPSGEGPSPSSAPGGADGH